MGKKATKKATKTATPAQAAAIAAAVAMIDAKPVPEEGRIVAPEQPRSRYDDVRLDHEDDSVYLPPRMDLDGMTKEQLAQTSMRYLGHRPKDGTKDAQIEQVRRELRGGLPGYGR